MLGIFGSLLGFRRSLEALFYWAFAPAILAARRTKMSSCGVNILFWLTRVWLLLGNKMAYITGHTFISKVFMVAFYDFMLTFNLRDFIRRIRKNGHPTFCKFRLIFITLGAFILGARLNLLVMIHQISLSKNLWCRFEPYNLFWWNGRNGVSAGSFVIFYWYSEGLFWQKLMLALILVSFRMVQLPCTWLFRAAHGIIC